MAATREDISLWFDHGVTFNSKYMVIICDTYDWEDYPAYFSNADEARMKMRAPGEMQKVMECYDLGADKEVQMNQFRAMALTV
jgi:hypothetical protein